jgi:xanthine dehydrogenase molybdenum-binding subunit
MMLPISSIYRVPNVFFEAKIVYTNNTYCQAMRGYGNPQAAFAVESNLDHLAEEAGMDPYELRQLNKNIPNDITPMGLNITSCGHEECMRAVADKLKWKDKRGKGPEVENGKVRGVGMACLFHVGGSGRVYKSDGSGVIMKLDDFGNVTVMAGGVEMGQGFEASLRLASAEALGVTPEKIKVVTGDTATCPWDVGTHASRGAFTACNAAILAALKARETIFELAAEHFMPHIEFKQLIRKKKDSDYQIPDMDYARILKASDFDMREDVIFLKQDPDNPILRLQLEEILREAHYKEQGTMIITEAFYDPCNEMVDMKTCRGNTSAAYIFGAQGVEVEVDLETGEVKILNFAAAHDVGQVLSRQAIRGQIYGGVLTGIGYALSEEYRAEKGKNMNPNFLDYKILSAPDVDFPIHAECIETHDEEGPFGAKGVGEPGLVPTAPAIANAIYDAIGVRMRELPMTPDRILKAIKGKGE